MYVNHPSAALMIVRTVPPTYEGLVLLWYGGGGMVWYHTMPQHDTIPSLLCKSTSFNITVN
jgi:hypothetical protein